jgi:hypothetical protein
MSENDDKKQEKPKPNYLELKYGKEPKITKEEIENPNWH